jgi:hypothetical protein
MMSRHDGAHTHGHGGGGFGLVLIVALVLVVAAIGKAVSKAVAEAAHVLAVVLEVVMISVVSLLGLAIAAAFGWAGLRLYRRYTNRAAAADPRLLDQPVRVTAEVVRAEPQAIEGPKPRLGLHLAEVGEEVPDARS